MNILQTEPALVIAGGGTIAELVLVAVIAYGVPITPDAKLATSALITGVVTVLTGWVIRGQVTSPATLAKLMAPGQTTSVPVPGDGGPVTASSLTMRIVALAALRQEIDDQLAQVAAITSPAPVATPPAIANIVSVPAAHVEPRQIAADFPIPEPPQLAVATPPDSAS